MQKLHSNLIPSVLGSLKMNELFLVLTLILILSSCAPKVDPVQTVVTRTIETQRPSPIVPEVGTLDLRPLTWVVITEDNYSSVLSKLKEQGNSTTIYGLTEDGYKNLSLNNNDVVTVIREYKNVIAVYEKSYLETCC